MWVFVHMGHLLRPWLSGNPGRLLSEWWLLSNCSRICCYACNLANRQEPRFFTVRCAVTFPSDWRVAPVSADRYSTRTAHTRGSHWTHGIRLPSLIVPAPRLMHS